MGLRGLALELGIWGGGEGGCIRKGHHWRVPVRSKREKQRMEDILGSIWTTIRNAWCYAPYFGDFTNDFAEVFATVLAILVPLNAEIVEKIVGKYKSLALSALYESYWYVKYLPLSLVSFIVILICARFLRDTEYLNNALWYFMSKVLLIGTAMLLIMVYKQYKLIMLFMRGGSPLVKVLVEQYRRAK